jgi:hypothetical protein
MGIESFLRIVENERLWSFRAFYCLAHGRANPEAVLRIALYLKEILLKKAVGNFDRVFFRC